MLSSFPLSLACFLSSFSILLCLVYILYCAILFLVVLKNKVRRYLSSSLYILFLFLSGVDFEFDWSLGCGYIHPLKLIFLLSLFFVRYARCYSWYLQSTYVPVLITSNKNTAFRCFNSNTQTLCLLPLITGFVKKGIAATALARCTNPVDGDFVLFGCFVLSFRTKDKRYDMLFWGKM